MLLPFLFQTSLVLLSPIIASEHAKHVIKAIEENSLEKVELLLFSPDVALNIQDSVPIFTAVIEHPAKNVQIFRLLVNDTRLQVSSESNMLFSDICWNKLSEFVLILLDNQGFILGSDPFSLVEVAAFAHHPLSTLVFEHPNINGQLMQDNDRFLELLGRTFGGVNHELAKSMVRDSPVDLLPIVDDLVCLSLKHSFRNELNASLNIQLLLGLPNVQINGPRVLSELVMINNWDFIQILAPYFDKNDPLTVEKIFELVRYAFWGGYVDNAKHILSQGLIEAGPFAQDLAAQSIVKENLNALKFALSIPDAQFDGLLLCKRALSPGSISPRIDYLILLLPLLDNEKMFDFYSHWESTLRFKSKGILTYLLEEHIYNRPNFALMMFFCAYLFKKVPLLHLAKCQMYSWFFEAVIDQDFANIFPRLLPEDKKLLECHRKAYFKIYPERNRWEVDVEKMNADQFEMFSLSIVRSFGIVETDLVFEAMIYAKKREKAFPKSVTSSIIQGMILVMNLKLTRLEVPAIESAFSRSDLGMVLDQLRDIEGPEVQQDRYLKIFEILQEYILSKYPGNLALDPLVCTVIFYYMAKLQSGNVQLLGRLLSSPKFHQSFDEFELTNLACSLNELKLLKALLDLPRVHRFFNCSHLLKTAAMSNNCEAALMVLSHPMLKMYIDPNMLNHKLFEIAIKNGHAFLLEFLLANHRTDISSVGNDLIQLSVIFDQPEALVLLRKAGAVAHEFQQVISAAIFNGKAKALTVLLPDCAKGALNLYDFSWISIPNADAVLKALLDHSETLGLTMQKDICRLLSIPNGPIEVVEIVPGIPVQLQKVVSSDIRSDLKDAIWKWIVRNADKDGILAKFENSKAPFDLNKFVEISNHFSELKCIAATELLKEKIIERYFLLKVFNDHKDKQALIEILKFHAFN